MRPADALELVVLAAVWGGSFIFMRMGAGEFGEGAQGQVTALPVEKTAYEQDTKSLFRTNQWQLIQNVDTDFRRDKGLVAR